MSTLTFLIADNDPNGILQIQTFLEKEFKANLLYVHTAEKLKQEVSKKPNILFYDLGFDKSTDPINLLAFFHKLSPETIIIPLISSNNTHIIKDVLSLQLFFYVTKPFDVTELQITLRRAIETQLISTPPTAISTPQISSSFQGMIGKSLSMKKLYDTIEKVAEDDFSTVLIRGESGTGKEMVAKAIHNASIRKSQNFVPVNCAAIPEELLESELFGYTKGAFTGATTNKIGRIQYADKGTLFLDEIGDMKPSLQAKLLRVIQEREFEPVGGFKAQSVDTRILAATHCDLEKLVKEGLFREDLYYRLSVIPLEIPPLRHRKEDIPLLIEKFITSYTTKRARKPFIFSAKAMSSLTNHQWQGNVRELENLIQHMSVLYSGDEVCLKELPIKFQNQIEELSFTELQPTTTKPQEVAKSKSNEFDELVDERQLLFGGEITESFNFQDKDDQVTEQSVDQTQIFNLPEVNWQEDGIDFKFIVGQFEDALITHALRTVKGNKKVAAELLRLKRTTLIEKIKKKGLQDCWI